MNPNLEEATQRIRFCHRKRRNHLNLAELGLTTAELDAIPEFAKLTHLEFLDLTGNELTELPRGLSAFTRLRWLGLNFNRLSRVDGVEWLQSLERLYLRGNQVSKLPPDMGTLQYLVELDLHGNNLLALPAEFLPLLEERRGVYLDLSNNGGQLSQQFEAAEGIREKRAALRAFLKDAESGVVMQRQGKLLLVGEGGVGKSTLLKVLRGEAFVVNNDTTHGLELEKLALKSEEGWEGELHCWDFSGQPAMRQTHQLFFTHPALYLLVWNHREAREAETTAELTEWLTMIDQRTEGQGRVLLVVKKAEGREATPHGYEEILHRFGPQARGGRGGILLEDCCVRVNSVSEEEMVKNGVPASERQRRHAEAAEQVQALRRRIASYAAQTENFNEEVPKPWSKAQAHFLGLRKSQPSMPWKVFRKACDGFGISDPEAYVRTQHRIGTLVWTERLKRGQTLDEAERDQQLVVLNPDWLSKALGYVIERDDQRQNRLGAEVPPSPKGTPGGLVSARQMDAIWRDPPVGRNQPPLHFDEALFDFFREVMSGYDICREVRHPGGGKEHWFLVPNRLPETRPTTWESAWPKDQPEVFWRVELRVPATNGEAGDGTPLNHWLGRAVFYRLMVILHEHALGRQDFAQAAHWRGGLILAPEGGGLARVVYNGSDRADAQKVTGFDLQVAAHAPREVWHVFAHALDYLLRDLRENYDYADIRVVRMVSCPRSLCAREAAQRWYTKDVFLQEMAQSGKDDWKAETTRCNLCNNKFTNGQLWEGRTGSEEGVLERIESKIDGQTACLSRVERSVGEMAANTERLLSQNRGIMLQVHELKVTTGEQLKGMDERLHAEMRSMKEALHAEMRRTLEVLKDGEDELPRLYTLTPDPQRWFGLARRTWRLRLHCERTLWPVCLVDPQGKGEFTVDESEDFLNAIAPYLKHVSTGLVAVCGLTALLGSPSLAPLLPAAVAAMLEWEKSYSKPLGEVSKLIKERAESTTKGLHDTGERVNRAEGAALLWLQDFIRQQPNYRSKLGLMPKPDGQGQRIWVLPGVEV